MNYEAPLTRLVWLTSIVSVALTYVASYLLIPDAGRRRRRSGGSSRRSSPAARWPARSSRSWSRCSRPPSPRTCSEVVTSSQRGRRIAQHPVRARRRQLQRLLARHGDHGADGGRLLRCSTMGLGDDRHDAPPAVFAFGLVAFGFLGMGPVTIAVDSYGPVTDNAQSVYELSTIEQMPNIKAELKKNFGFDVEFRARQAQPRGERRRRQHVQGHRQAGAHRHGRRRRDDDDLLDHRRADGRPHDRTSTSSRSCTRRSCSA